MLSYQHLYHAGNMADVHKHALLAWVLDYMTQKDKPISYIETHGGRGLYDLAAPEAIKTGEAAAGIAHAESWFGAQSPYRTALTALREKHGAQTYPGSPLIAKQLLRDTDSITISELHPTEHDALRQNLKGVAIKRQDGAELALSMCPPAPRRGMMLIDPSYEIKSEYAAMAELVRKLHRKWPVGVIALWYPLLEDAPHRPMIAGLPEGVWCHEVRFPPARPGHRMVGSGMAFINPPWGLADAGKWLTQRFMAHAKLHR